MKSAFTLIYNYLRSAVIVSFYMGLYILAVLVSFICAYMYLLCLSVCICLCVLVSFLCAYVFLLCLSVFIFAYVYLQPFICEEAADQFNSNLFQFDTSCLPTFLAHFVFGFFLFFKLTILYGIFFIFLFFIF